MNLPNKLTVCRVILIPFFVFFLLNDAMNPNFKWIALAIFIVASLTDLLDGKIARKYNLVRTGFSGEYRLSVITVYIPIEHIGERELKMLFDYFTFRMDVVEKKFNYTSNADNEICELNILIHTDLYDVEITNDEDGGKCAISFVSEDSINLDKLCCLAIIANNEKQFAKELLEYVDNHAE